MKNNSSRFMKSLTGFLIFLITSSVIVSLTVLIYDKVRIESDGNTLYLSLVMIFSILFLAIIMTLIDYIRRRLMVDKAVNQILNGTKRIINGDFNVTFTPRHGYGKYDEFDIIMDNLNKVTKELSKNELLKNDFISNVSHEIKTPLSVMKLYAGELLDESLDPNLKKEYINTIIKSSESLSSLVSNILKLNKLENQTIFNEKKCVNVSNSIENSILSFESLLENKEIDLECNLEDDVYMNVDKSLLELIWNNLLSNAIKFSNKGGKIIIKLDKINDVICVVVKDNGIGMSKETGERIFDKFYQGDTSHQLEGNGLGLALVKKVIDLIGGQIMVESTLGLGSSFIVRLRCDE